MASLTRLSFHSMLSYCWSVNKPLVIALGKKLRDLGYDVWRDEEGSSIMHSMSGDIVETMGEAVDRSYAVIIFVSPEYKESTNCRQEAGYAQARSANSNLKIIYLMMNAHYYTRSQPRKVDGWLGFMIASDLWYPLWDEDNVNTTANALGELLGNNARLTTNAGSAVQVPSFPWVTASTQSVSSVFSKQKIIMATIPDCLPSNADLVTAFNILQQPKKTHCPNAWMILLNDLSIESPNDLKDVEVRKLLALAELMKPIPSSQFLEALKL
jgi:hypothetical protein